MTRPTSSARIDDHGWLITPRAIGSLATVVGLIYTLHAPVRYVLHLGDTVEALNSRVATLETELDQQRGTIAAATLVLESHARDETSAPTQASEPRASGGTPSPREHHQGR